MTEINNEEPSFNSNSKEIISLEESIRNAQNNIAWGHSERLVIAENRILIRSLRRLFEIKVILLPEENDLPINTDE